MALHHTLLGLLSFYPRTGYELKQVFESSVIHFWNAHISQIYRELSHMEQKGLVTFYIEPQEGKPDKKIYSITEEGKKVFIEWLHEFPDGPEGVMRSEFLSRIFFASYMDVPDIAYELKRFVRRQEMELEKLRKCEEQIERRKQRGENTLFWYMTLRKGVKSVQASIEWGKECLELLEEMDKK